MYANNNLASLGRLHTNALIKSQSPLNLKTKPLSQIQNSLQKLKARKKKSKSKSKSKQNTPENDKVVQRRSSISNRKNNVYFHKYQQKPPIRTYEKGPKKALSHFSQHINSVVSSYDNSSIKTPSQISINSKNLAESNTSSCISSDYLIPISSQLSQKSVRFSDKHLQVNMIRTNQKKMTEKQEDKSRTPSILKKKLSINSVNSQRSSSIKSSTKVSRTKEYLEIQSISANKLIKSKYETLIKKYEDLNKRFGKNSLKSYPRLQKFTDDIFPPQNSSIFSYSIHSKSQKPKSLEWKRIPEIYSQQNIIVVREQNSKSLIKIKKSNVNKQFPFVEDSFITALNCIRQNKRVLDKIFQIKQINLAGIYLLKIYQQKSWKYVIIDDLIPVIYDQLTEKYIPAFVNVQMAQGNTGDTIQIWPHLLEKAYAAYYSKFQALKFGYQIDFMEEFTGVPAKQIKISNINFQNKQNLQFQAILREEKGVILGLKIVQQKQIFFCILPDLNSITKKAQGFCTYLSNEKNYKPIKQKLDTFLNTLTKIYVFDLDIPEKIGFSYLCPEQKRSTEGSFKYKKDQIKSQNTEQNEIALRCFTITQQTKTIISIKQKDQRFYFQGKLEYKYIWMRAILLFKEHNGDYRWIDGRYSNKKSLNIFTKLDVGQYYLLLMPEWSNNFKYDIGISIYTQNCIPAIEKRIYEKNQQIFEKGCADISQRQGSMNQINKYICAYNYVSQDTGLVVQNINNERQNGPVTVMRSINGLKCQVSLVPVNKQFYFCTSSEYENQASTKMKKTIEVDIQANQHYTVVLKTIGGIDHKFFDSFDFGC